MMQKVMLSCNFVDYAGREPEVNRGFMAAFNI